MSYQSADVSVILPVFNGARFLGAALESIGQQTVRVGEVIVVDDGSVDETAAIAKRNSVATHYHYQPNQGANIARNRGLQMTTGKLITFLDADDLWAQNKIEVQLSLINRHDVVIGHSQLVDHEKQPFLFLNLAAALFRSEIFESVGRLDTTLSTIDDLDWFFRAREMGARLRIHSDVVLFHRRHANNLTKQQASNNQREMLQMLHRSVQRRRQQGQTAQPQFSHFVEDGETR